MNINLGDPIKMLLQGSYHNSGCSYNHYSTNKKEGNCVRTAAAEYSHTLQSHDSHRGIQKKNATLAEKSKVHMIQLMFKNHIGNISSYHHRLIKTAGGCCFNTSEGGEYKYSRD